MVDILSSFTHSVSFLFEFLYEFLYFIELIMEVNVYLQLSVTNILYFVFNRRMKLAGLVQLEGE